MCEFPSDYMHGEMIKKRPVIIVNNKMTTRPTLVNIVPISMTAPNTVCAHHVNINRMYLPRGLSNQPGERWAKCDMVYTMSIERLELVRAHRGQNGKRVTDKGTLPPAVLLAVRIAAAKCLGVHAGSFTKVNGVLDKLVPAGQELAAVSVQGMPELAANAGTVPGRDEQAFA